MFRLATLLFTHTSSPLRHGSYHIIDTVTSFMNDVTLDCLEWIYIGANFACLQLLCTFKTIITDWILILVMNYNILYIMISQTPTLSHRKFVRLRKKCHKQNKVLLMSYSDLFYIYSNTQIKREDKWQVQNPSSCYPFENVYKTHLKNIEWTNGLFDQPITYITNRIKKPPDRIFHALWDFFSITSFFVLYFLFGCFKILYF